MASAGTRSRVDRFGTADDFVMGFEHEDDAQRMLNDLTVRLSKFGLSLNEDKTRLLLFGKFASERRARRGLGRPETFDFLGCSVLQRHIERRAA